MIYLYLNKHLIKNQVADAVTPTVTAGNLWPWREARGNLSAQQLQLVGQL